MLYDRNMVLNLSSRLCCIIWRKATLVANISKQVNGSICIYTPGAMLVSGRLIHVTPAQCASPESSTGRGLHQSNAPFQLVPSCIMTIPPWSQRAATVRKAYPNTWDIMRPNTHFISQISACVSLTKNPYHSLRNFLQQIPSKSHSCFTAACEAYIALPPTSK